MNEKGSGTRVVYPSVELGQTTTTTNKNICAK